MGACESCKHFYVAADKEPECKFGFEPEEDCGLYEHVQFVRRKRRIPKPCEHEPNWDGTQLILEVTAEGGVKYILDVPCKHCLKTGSTSVTVHVTDINWG